MAEFEVTGVRYQMGEHLTMEKRTELAEEYIRQLQNGTEMMLVAEPDNLVDSDAVAVYTAADIRKVGYIKHESCRLLKPKLEEESCIKAVVCGNDCHVTFFIDVPDVAEHHLAAKHQQRQLPECPLPKGIALPFTEEERKLQVVAPMLCQTEICVENMERWISLAEVYMPLSRLSLTREDDLWRDQILKQFRAALQLNLPAKQMAKLRKMHGDLHITVGDFHYVHIPWQPRVFNLQLSSLKMHAEEKGGLFERFDNYIKTSNISPSDIKQNLSDWFAAMPRVELHDYTNRDTLAKSLSYLGITRQELYEVFAALLLIEHMEAPEKATPTAKHKEIVKTQTIIDQLENIFYGDREEAAKFLKQIQGMKPVEITKLVSDLIKERTISDYSSGRDLWTVLHDAGLYIRKEPNWNDQLRKHREKD